MWNKFDSVKEILYQINNDLDIPDYILDMYFQG